MEKMTIHYGEKELDQLRKLGLKIGARVKLSRMTTITAGVEIGDDSQVDGPALLDGKVVIGRNCHIGWGSLIFGSEGFTMGDFSGVSPYTMVFTASDGIGGLQGGPGCAHGFNQFRELKAGPVRMGCNVTVFAGGILLPGTAMEDGAILAANACLARGTVPAYEVWGGTPAKKIADRDREPSQTYLNLAQLKLAKGGK